MGNKLRLICAGLLLVFFISEIAIATPVANNYFVRPALRVGSGEIIDGLRENGPLSATQTQSVTGYSSSTVDLEDGTVKMYSTNGPSSPSLQTFGSLGERLTVTGGAGTTVDISFQLEGAVYGDVIGPEVPGNSPATFFYDLAIVALRPGQADWSNFWGIANDPCWGQDPLSCVPLDAPLVNEYYTDSITLQYDGEDSFYIDVDETLIANLNLTSNYETFDLFIFTNVSVWTDFESGLGDFTADFGNTASLGLNLQPGVTGFSSSGKFLGLQTPPPPPPGTEIPEPSSLLLLGLGLAGIRYSKKKSAKHC